MYIIVLEILHIKNMKIKAIASYGEANGSPVVRALSDSSLWVYQSIHKQLQRSAYKGPPHSV